MYSNFIKIQCTEITLPDGAIITPSKPVAINLHTASIVYTAVNYVYVRLPDGSTLKIAIADMPDQTHKLLEGLS